MKAFTPKDVKDGYSLESPFAAIKVELKAPAGVTPTVEWFIEELHKRTCRIHDYVYLQLPDREWALQCMAPGAIHTMPEYLKKWLISDEDYIKNRSCKLSQHGVNYIMLMLKYFSKMGCPSLTSLVHIFYHPRMLKSIKFPDSIMSVEGRKWMLKDPNMGCHSFRTNKGSICPLVHCGCLFSDSQQLCQHILKHNGHIWGCDKCWEYCGWDTGMVYDHWTSENCDEWKGKLLLMEQEQEA